MLVAVIPPDTREPIHLHEVDTIDYLGDMQKIVEGGHAFKNHYTTIQRIMTVLSPLSHGQQLIMMANKDGHMMQLPRNLRAEVFTQHGMIVGQVFLTYEASVGDNLEFVGVPENFLDGLYNIAIEACNIRGLGTLGKVMGHHFKQPETT